MVCKTCGGADHKRITSKLCPDHKPKLKNALRTTLKEERESDNIEGRNAKIIVVSTVIKSCLNSPLKDVISTAAKTMTCVAADATRLLNLYLLILLENDQPIPNLSYNAFLRKPFQLVATGKANDEYLHVAKAMYGGTYQYDCDNYSQLISNMATDYETNCMNHVSTNIHRWIFKWYQAKMIKRFPHLKKPKLKSMFHADGEEDDPVRQRSIYLKSIVDNYAVNLDKDADYEKWWEYIPLMWHLQKRLCKTKGEKSFTLVPLTNYGIRHIRIDTVALHGLCSRAGMTNNLTRSQFKDDVDAQWRRLFPSIKETRNKKFAFGVTTDGVACSHYYQKRLVIEPRVVNADGFDENGVYHPIDLDGRTVVGYDPGRIDVFTAVGVNGAEEEVARLSRREYYMMTGMTYRLRERNRWMKKAENILAINTSTPPKRVSSSAEFVKHCDYVAKHLHTLVDFYGAKRFTRQKFKTYMGKQKTWDTIADRLTNGDRKVVIAFGNGSFPHNSKGGASTPLKRLYWELKRRCTVRLVDEYRTSITCSLCEGTLPKKSRFWQVKVCNDLCLTHWNRDVNAARNMRNILLYMNENGGRKPWPFLRAPV